MPNKSGSGVNEYAYVSGTRITMKLLMDLETFSENTQGCYYKNLLWQGTNVTASFAVSKCCMHFL